MYRPRLQPSNATHQPISQASSEVAAQAARVQAALKRLNGGWTSTYGSMCALVCNLWQLYGFLWDVHNSDNIFIFWYIVMISNASMWEILTLNCLSSFPQFSGPNLVRSGGADIYGPPKKPEDRAWASTRVSKNVDANGLGYYYLHCSDKSFMRWRSRLHLTYLSHLL